MKGIAVGMDAQGLREGELKNKKLWKKLFVMTTYELMFINKVIM